MSNYQISNGMALSPTFHRAYDNCLIFLDETHVMRLNEEKASELNVNDLDGGLTQFRSLLNKKIHLPIDVSQRPRIEYIKMANKHRRIPGYV